MLALTFTPAEVWRAPVDDAVYHGFDPNLMYARAGSGTVHVSPGSIDMTAPPNSYPTVNLATTLLPKLTAGLDVSVAENTATEPLRVGMWSPWTQSGQFLVFGPAPQNLITAETILNGLPGSTLIGGPITRSTVVGNYQPGNTYHVSLVIDKPNRIIETFVSGDDGTRGQATMATDQSPAIFGAAQVSLGASAFAGSGTSRVTLRNYSLTFPHQRAWASKVADSRAQFILVALIALGLLAFAIAIVARRQSIAAWFWGAAGIQTRMRGVAAARPGGRRGLVVMAGAIGVYLVGNALLFPVGGHPFDFAAEKLYAYVAHSYGPSQLYYLPNAVSLAAIWGGVPYVESAFPYEPVVVYVFAGIGWLNSALFAGGGAFSLSDSHLDYVIKGINVLFGLADGALIYLILGRLGVSMKARLIAAGLFLFNPAVWFSMSIWGQTHVMSIFFVLAAVLMAEKGHAVWAWLALAAGTLTRPQMLVFALVVGIVFLKMFPWRHNISALSWTVIVTFIVLAPLTLATSPSLPVDVMVHNFSVQAGGGNGGALTTVSQDAFSIWPLVTYLAHGAGGLGRVLTPSSNLLVGSLSYQRLGQVLTLAAMLLVSLALLTRRRVTEQGGYLPLVALGIMSFLMLVTGVVATHFLLALPFLLLCRRWMTGSAYYYVAAIWTITTFVPMFGDMGNSIRDLNYPVLGPAHNVITRSMIALYSWDRFITAAVVANICALIWLGWSALRPLSPIRLEPSGA